jgi:hypothetical protein
MGKRIRHTDLALEKPGARAELNLERDEVTVEAEFPLARIRFIGKAGTRSRLQPAMETFSVAAAGCGSVATIAAVGAPKWMAISALPLLFAFHLCIRYLPRRKRCESCRRPGACPADPDDPGQALLKPAKAPLCVRGAAQRPRLPAHRHAVL